MTVMCALRLVTIEQKMNGWNNASYLHRQEEGTPAMTVMCALRLVTIEQKLADEAVSEAVTRQVQLHGSSFLRLCCWSTRKLQPTLADKAVSEEVTRPVCCNFSLVQ